VPVENDWLCVEIECRKHSQLTSERLWEFLAEWDVLGINESEAEGATSWKIYLPAQTSRENFHTAFQEWLTQTGLDPQSVTVGFGLVPRENWNEKWKQFFVPVHVPPDYVICPPWAADTNGFRGKVSLIIEPGMAFGTGTHATTQLCLTMLRTVFKAGMTVLDVGTGSGILCIACAKLGAKWCLGVDNDPLIAENAALNLRLNGISSEQVSIAVAELSAFRVHPFDLVLCNMLPQHLLPLVPTIKQFLSLHSFTVVTGFLEAERREIEEALSAHGLRVAARDCLGEWGGCIVHLV